MGKYIQFQVDKEDTLSTRGSAFNIRDRTMCQHGVVHSKSVIRNCVNMGKYIQFQVNKEDTASTRGSAFNIRYQTLCQHGVLHSISGK